METPEVVSPSSIFDVAAALIVHLVVACAVYTSSCIENKMTQRHHEKAFIIMRSPFENQRNTFDYLQSSSDGARGSVLTHDGNHYQKNPNHFATDQGVSG